MNDDEISELVEGVGARLHLARDALRLSQSEFARRAGVAPNTYNQIERGRKRMSIEIALAICLAHDLDMNWIYMSDSSNLKYKLADSIRALQESQSDD